MRTRFNAYACFLGILLFLSGCGGFKPVSITYRCEEPPVKLDCCDKAGERVAALNDQCLKPKNIVIFLDGTSNDRETRTNVRRLYEIIANQDRHDIAIYYDSGVGTDIHKVTGNLFGVGFGRNVRQAYRFLAEQYEPGDKVYIFGFSRGAAEARSVSGMVKFIGLVDRNFRKKTKPREAPDETSPGKETAVTSEPVFADPVDEAFKVYAGNNGADFEAKRAALKKKFRFVDGEIPLRVVGVWDTVESLGFPILSRKQHVRVNAGHRVELHDNIDYAFHALAINELRVPYQPLLWEPEDLAANNAAREKTGRKPQVMEQVWFIGAHSDVGGGYEDSKDLSGITLNWMLEQLERTEGYDLLPIKYRVHENVLGAKHDSHKGIFNVSKEKPRDMLACGQKVHISAVQRIKLTVDREEKDFKPWPKLFVNGDDKINKPTPYVLNGCFEIVE